MKMSDRMKRYELASTHYLPCRMPIIVRCDGKSFHSYTRGLSKNDARFNLAMDSTAAALCEQIDGARLAYVQSDEISVLVNPWTSYVSEPWFGNRLQKIVSNLGFIRRTKETSKN